MEIPKKNPRALLEAVAKQPVSIGMNCFCSNFMLYKGGILTKGCPSIPLNHAVTVVGYGSEGGIDFWIIKNSWGPRWGEQGFIRVERKMVEGDSGMGGMTTLASYPVLK